jgi:hypothetical protein
MILEGQTIYLRGMSLCLLNELVICGEVALKPSTNICLFLERNIGKIRNRDSVVDIATGYGLDDQGVGVRVLVESRIFSFPRRPYRLRGPSNPLSIVHRGLFPGVKRPGLEADHSPPASADVKEMWIYKSTSP